MPRVAGQYHSCEQKSLSTSPGARERARYLRGEHLLKANLLLFPPSAPSNVWHGPSTCNRGNRGKELRGRLHKGPTPGGGAGCSWLRVHLLCTGTAVFLRMRVGWIGVGLLSAAGPGAQPPEPPPVAPAPHSIISLIHDPIYLYSAYHSRPFLGMRTRDHVLDTAHLPALPVPGGAIPPPIIKYISLYATYLHPISPGERLPTGPSPWSRPTGVPPTANTRPLASGGSGTTCGALGGAPGAADSGKSTAVTRPKALEKKYTPLQSHTREGDAGPPSSPDTRDFQRRGSKQKRRGTHRRAGLGGPPRAPHLSAAPGGPPGPRGGSQGTRATLTSKHPAPRTLV